MIYRRLDADHDWVFGGGINDFLSGVDAVSQAIDTRLRLYTGEWWEDTMDGIPMWNAILGKWPMSGNKKSVADMVITQRIRETQGVTAVVNVASTWNSTNRAYRYSASAYTIYSPQPVAVTV